MDILDTLKEFGGVVGSTSLGAVGYVLKRFRAAEAKAKAAQTLARGLEERLEAMEHKLETLKVLYTEQKAKTDELERDLSAYVREEVSQWRALQRSLGQIEGKLASRTKEP